MEPGAALEIITTAVNAGPAAALAFVVYILWKENKAEREGHMKTLRDQIVDRDKTIKDYNEFTEVLKDLTDAIHDKRRP